MYHSILTALLVVAVLPAAALAQLKVVTTTTDFADLARQVGGDRVTVDSVMKGPENVHNVLAKPTEMLKVNRADVFVHGGLDAEPWRDGLLKGARNPRVMPGQPGNVDLSQGIELRDVPHGRVDRAQGDIHAFGNPHYQLSPASAQRMAATLARALIEVDPDAAETYRANAKRFVNEMADLHRELRTKLAPYGGLKVVTFHKGWDYFADAFGIDIAAVIEPKVGITPSPADLRNVIETMKREGVKVVIVETYNSFDQAKFVADAAGAQIIVLPDHVNGVAGVGTYQDLFRHDVDAIIAGAEAAGIRPAEAPAKERGR